jgi:hypothetical protein
MTQDDEYRRLPGLFRAWDLQAVLTDGTDYQMDRVGTTDDGTPLYAVYARPIQGVTPTPIGRPQ